jgi:hypothetical protein
MFSAGVTARRQIKIQFQLVLRWCCSLLAQQEFLFFNISISHPPAPSPPTPPGHHAIALKHGLHTSGRSESFDIFLFFGHYHYRYHHHQY